MIEIQAKLKKVMRKIAKRKEKIDEAKKRLGDIEVLEGGRDIVGLQNQVKAIETGNEEMRKKKKYLEALT